MEPDRINAAPPEDLAAPDLQKVTSVLPFADYQFGGSFLDWFFKPEAGKLDPYR